MRNMLYQILWNVLNECLQKSIFTCSFPFASRLSVEVKCHVDFHSSIKYPFYYSLQCTKLKLVFMFSVQFHYFSTLCWSYLFLYVFFRIHFVHLTLSSRSFVFGITTHSLMFFTIGLLRCHGIGFTRKSFT